MNFEQYDTKEKQNHIDLIYISKSYFNVLSIKRNYGFFHDWLWLLNYQ